MLDNELKMAYAYEVKFGGLTLNTISFVVVAFVLVALGCWVVMSWWWPKTNSALVVREPLPSVVTSTIPAVVATATTPVVAPLPPTPTTGGTTVPPTPIAYDDEGRFTFVLSPETVERFTGTNAWTRQEEDYYYVSYQEPSRARMEKSLRLDEVEGFVYDPAYTYTITVWRTRDPQRYGAMDVGWYRYTLDAVVTKAPVL